jgi:hypothetical protein
MIEAIRWDGRSLHLLDQRRLPTEELWLRFESLEPIARAISDMVVRGAPAIAFTACYGLVLAERNGIPRDEASRRLLASRPTAVNLRWAMTRMVGAASLEDEAVAIHLEDRSSNQALGRNGAELLDGGVLTICNTGSLATGGHGTALGMVRSALALGRPIHVYALRRRRTFSRARGSPRGSARRTDPCDRARGRGRGHAAAIRKGAASRRRMRSRGEAWRHREQGGDVLAWQCSHRRTAFRSTSPCPRPP